MHACLLVSLLWCSSCDYGTSVQLWTNNLSLSYAKPLTGYQPYCITMARPQPIVEFPLTDGEEDRSSARDDWCYQSTSPREAPFVPLASGRLLADRALTSGREFVRARPGDSASSQSASPSPSGQSTPRQVRRRVTPLQDQNSQQLTPSGQPISYGAPVVPALVIPQASPQAPPTASRADQGVQEVARDVRNLAAAVGTSSGRVASAVAELQQRQRQQDVASLTDRGQLAQAVQAVATLEQQQQQLLL